MFGPTFGNGDVTITSVIVTTDGVFDGRSSADVGNTYEDALGTGIRTFTGMQSFTPVEIEVYRVI